MKPLYRVVFILGVFLISTGAGTKSLLIGKWSREYGEGTFRTVTLYEFKEDGTFYREETHPALPLGGETPSNKRVNGKWSLTTKETGVRALLADPNRLTLEYEKWPSEKPGGLTPTRSAEVYSVVISKEEMFGGKETLRLGPTDGDIMGTEYFFRVDSSH